MTDLVIRPLAPGETQLFESLTDAETGLTGVAQTGRDFAETLHTGHYRPQWTWVALRGGAVVARAAWWGGPHDAEPVALDWFDPGADLDVAAALLRAASFTSEYVFLLPAGWREEPATRRAAERRIDAAQRAGMTPLVERLHYGWTPDRGLPERPGRLVFRLATDDDVVRDVLRRVLAGTLDAYSVRDVARLGLDGATDAALDMLLWYPAPREWWRIAYRAAEPSETAEAGRGSETADAGRSTDAAEMARQTDPADASDVVGITVPTKNFRTPVIGFVGVVPEHRGHGYAFDLLVEATHVLVANGAAGIEADTDTTNVPMAATFARAGYPVTQRRMVLTYE